MGNTFTLRNSDTPENPKQSQPPTFPPDFGFEAPRKVRESKISEEEMSALKLTSKQRDYCAHHFKEIHMCKKKYFPFVGACKPEYHDYHKCLLEDYFLRMKEYEREKRLRLREQKIMEAAATA